MSTTENKSMVNPTNPGEAKTLKEADVDVLKNSLQNLVGAYHSELGRGVSHFELMKIRAGEPVEKVIGERGTVVPTEYYEGLKKRIKSFHLESNPKKEFLNKNIAIHMRELDIPDRAPIFLPPMDIKHPSILFPGTVHQFPKLDLFANRPASYYPTQFYTQPHFLPFEFLALIRTNMKDKEMQAEVDKLIEKALTAANHYFMGNGTWMGQLGRMKLVRDVYFNVRKPIPDFHKLKIGKWQQNLPMVQKYDAFWSIMRLQPLHSRYKIKDLGNTVYDICEGWRKQYPNDEPLAMIEKDSDAGIMYVGKVIKLFSFETDFQLAEFFARAAHEVGPKRFFELYPWSRLVKLKPKAEITKRAKVETNIRNIQAYNFCFQLIPHIIFKNAFLPFRNYLEDPEVTSLLEFNPFKGNMHKLVLRLHAAREAGNPLILTYADNLYYYGPKSIKEVDGEWMFISLDAEKMEASHRLQDIIEFNRYILTKVWRVRLSQQLSSSAWADAPETDENEESWFPPDVDMVGDTDSPMLPIHWVTYFLLIYPIIVCHAQAVFGEHQMPVPGMGTGCVGTAYYNQAKICPVAVMARHLYEAGHTMWTRDKNNEVALGLGIRGAANYGGVVFKIEAATPEADIESGGKWGEDLRLDLMGYDARKYLIAGMAYYVPVLNEDRFNRSIVLLKNPDEDITLNDGTKVPAELARIMKNKCLYLTRGWLSLVWGKVLQEMTIHEATTLNGRKFIATNIAVKAAVENTIGQVTEAMLDLITDLISRPNMPTLQEAIGFSLGEGPMMAYINQMKDTPELAALTLTPEAFNKYVKAPHITEIETQVYPIKVVPESLFAGSTQPRSWPPPVSFKNPPPTGVGPQNKQMQESELTVPEYPAIANPLAQSQYRTPHVSFDDLPYAEQFIKFGDAAMILKRMRLIFKEKIKVKRDYSMIVGMPPIYTFYKTMNLYGMLLKAVLTMIGSYFKIPYVALISTFLALKIKAKEFPLRLDYGQEFVKDQKDTWRQIMTLFDLNPLSRDVRTLIEKFDVDEKPTIGAVAMTAKEITLTSANEELIDPIDVTETYVNDKKKLEAFFSKINKLQEKNTKEGIAPIEQRQVAIEMEIEYSSEIPPDMANYSPPVNKNWNVFVPSQK